MIRIRFILATLIAVLFTLPTGTASTATDDATARLRVAVDEVLKAAERSKDSASLEKALRPVLDKYLSFDAMTRRAVGPGWKQFTSDQKSDAASLFATLIIRTYGNKLTPGEFPVIDFKPASEPAPNRVDVPTTLVYKGSKYDVTYRMEKTTGWVVTDVVIEGVSFVANYRAQFDALFKKGGAVAVIDSLSQSVNRKP